MTAACVSCFCWAGVFDDIAVSRFGFRLVGGTLEAVSEAAVSAGSKKRREIARVARRIVVDRASDEQSDGWRSCDRPLNK